MNIANYSFLGGRLEMSWNEIIDRVKPEPDDIVILSGTLVEGIGNKHSDIDAYVITKTLPTTNKMGKHNYLGCHDGRVRQYYDYLENQGFGFDVEYYTPAEINEMIAEVETLHALARTSTKILRKKLAWSVEDALHKFHIGECLTNSDAYARVFPSGFWKKLSFVQYRNRIGGYPEFKDIMGSWGSGDFETSLFVTTPYLLDQAAALCHITGATNGKQKWILKNLHRLPAHLSKLGQDILTWLDKGKPDDAAKSEAVLEACDLMERIYRELSEFLDAEPETYFSCGEALQLIEAEYQRESYHDPQTVLEFEHRRRIYSSVGRGIRSFLVDNA